MPPQIDFDPTVDYYGALGVPTTATQDEIKHAHRELARLYHPDSTGGDKAKEQRFKTIQAAYDVVGDPKRRALYDEVRVSRRQSRGGGFGQVPFDINDFGGLGALFNQIFGEVPSPPRYPQPEEVPDIPAAVIDKQIQASDGTWLRVEESDVHSDVRIPFEQAISGTAVTVATIDGTSDVKVPPGTSSGKKLRLRGKGVEGQGDHFVTVQIDVPRIDDLAEESRKILGQLLERVKKRTRVS